MWNRVLSAICLVALLAGCSPRTGTAALDPTESGSPARDPSSAAVSTPSRAPSVAPADGVPPTMLVWIPGGLPLGFAGKVAHLPGVAREVTVVCGSVWMTNSSAGAPPSGFRIPVEVAGADPARLAPFLPAPDRHYLPSLRRGQALIGTLESKLRGFGAGGTMSFGGSTVRVAGVVPDADLGMHEVFTSLQSARRLGVRTRRYLLLQRQPGASWAAIDAAVRRLLPGTTMAVRRPSQVTATRQADSVLSPVAEKTLFGEFAARPDPGRPSWLIIDRAWVVKHIRTENVPILGRVTCNAKFFPPLRAALAQVVSHGLASDIDPSDYGGCYAPRVIPGDPGHALSHHAWGTAIDINVSRNPWGSSPHQPSALVRIFQAHGFEWGGRWLIPDGMHFEYLSPAPGERLANP